jgi:hypothetical protein
LEKVVSILTHTYKYDKAAFKKKEEKKKKKNGLFVIFESDDISRFAGDCDRLFAVGTGERDGFTVLERITRRARTRRVGTGSARVRFSLSIKTGYFYRWE